MIAVDLNGLILGCPNDDSGSNWVNIRVSKWWQLDLNGLILECPNDDSGSGQFQECQRVCCRG